MLFSKNKSPRFWIEHSRNCKKIIEVLKQFYEGSSLCIFKYFRNSIMIVLLKLIYFITWETKNNSQFYLLTINFSIWQYKASANRIFFWQHRHIKRQRNCSVQIFSEYIGIRNWQNKIQVDFISTIWFNQNCEWQFWFFFRPDRRQVFNWFWQWNCFNWMD